LSTHLWPRSSVAWWKRSIPCASTYSGRARGDEETYDSDYDVLVLVEQKTGTSYQMERQAYGSLRGLAAPIDIVVMSRDHFERRRMVVSSLSATIEREGRLLYAA